MKKLLIICILFSYSIASFGVSLNYFYCCGKLKSVSLVANTKENKCKGKSKKTCCNNKVVSFQLKIDQKESNKEAYHFNSPASHIAFPVAVYSNKTLSPSIQHVSLYENPPPDYLPSRQVLFCVFRI